METTPATSNPATPAGFRPGLHRFAVMLACAVVLLISAGAFVTSKGAGLSVPDWPLSYGTLNPPRWWQIATVRAEHGHRLLAGTVALLTVALALWAGRREPRRRVRRLAWLAVVAVFAQALLGGLTVLFFLPTPVSVGHAALAEIFLCLAVTLAVMTSRFWLRHAGAAGSSGAGRLAPLATAVSAAIYLQILLGAVMRHSGAGLAIPDFPLAFGGLVPPRFDFAIAIHYAHRCGALVVLALVAWTAGRVLRRHREHPWLARPAAAMALLVVLQICLGGAVVLTRRSEVINTLHVATGATLLATSLVLTLAVWRLAPRRERRAVAVVAARPREAAR